MKSRLSIILCCLVCVVVAAAADQFGSIPLKQLSLKSSDGTIHRLSDIGRVRASVFLFISNTCPISNRMNPEIKELQSTFGSRKVAFYGVITDPDLTPATIQEYSRSRSFAFPILMDGQQKLTTVLQAKVTPEAFIVAPSGKILYRGRINDLYTALGKSRPNGPTTHDLRDALSAVLDNKPVAVSSTEAIGCFITKRRAMK